MSLCSEIQSNDAKLMGRANKTSLLFCRLLPRRRCICLLISPPFFPRRTVSEASFFLREWQAPRVMLSSDNHHPPLSLLPPRRRQKKSSPPPVAVVATVSFLPLSDFCLRLRRHSTFPLPFRGPTFKVSLDRSLDFLQNNYSSFLYLQGDRRNLLPFSSSSSSSFLTAHPIPFLPTSPPPGLPLHSFCPLPPLFFISGLLLSYLPSSPFSCRFHWDRRSLSCPEKNLPAHLGVGRRISGAFGISSPPHPHARMYHALSTPAPLHAVMPYFFHLFSLSPLLPPFSPKKQSSASQVKV